MQSQSTLYTSLAAKIKSGGMFIGLLSGAVKTTAAMESEVKEEKGKVEDDYDNVGLGSA